MGETSAFSIVTQLVGEEAAEAIREHFAGEMVYIPRRPILDADTIRAEVDEVLPGSASVLSAYETVAERHNVSTRTIRRLVTVPVL